MAILYENPFDALNGVPTLMRGTSLYEKDEDRRIAEQQAARAKERQEQTNAVMHPDYDNTAAINKKVNDSLALIQEWDGVAAGNIRASADKILKDISLTSTMANIGSPNLFAAIITSQQIKALYKQIDSAYASATAKQAEWDTQQAELVEQAEQAKLLTARSEAWSDNLMIQNQSIENSPDIQRGTMQSPVETESAPTAPKNADDLSEDATRPKRKRTTGLSGSLGIIT